MADRPTYACKGLRKSEEIDQPTVGLLICPLLCLGVAHACPIDRCAIRDQSRSIKRYRWIDGPDLLV